MKILVTGGAGFIGSHLVDAYLKAGHHVSVVDNLDTGRKEFLNDRASFYQVDITNFKKLAKVFEREKPELVAHLAAFDHIRLSLEHPDQALKVNVLGTLNVLRLMVSYKSKKIIFASTAGPLYGFEPKPLPVKEDYPVKSISPYGASKAFAEELIKLYHRLHKIRYTIFRYPNVYGPRQFPKGEAKVVAVFALALLDGKRPLIFGDGSKTRDYAYIDDVIRAHLLALKKGDNEVLNIGWGKEVKDIEVFDTITKALGISKIKPIFGKAQLGEVYRFSLDISKVKKILGWKPTIPSEQGIRKTMPYYQEFNQTGIIAR